MPPANTFRYTERAPSPALAAWILSYWHFAADAAPPASDPHVVLPDGCTSICVLRPASLGAMVICVGPRATSFRPVITGGMQLAGVRLWPDTTQALLGVRPAELRNFMGPVPASLAARVRSLVAMTRRADHPDGMFDGLASWAADACRDVAPPEPRVRRAVQAIAAARGEISLRAVAAAAHVSTRQLQRLFPQATGITVSEYARIRRLREALAMRLDSHTAHWSRIAAERGFADHAHLTREFQALAGVSPSAVARQLGRIAHHDVTP